MERLRHWRTRILFLLAALGPGFITANVDNDAGGIYTYSFAGAHFGYSLLWTIIPTTIVLAIAQEITARMGVITGKTLSELIRENFGLRITFFLMLAMVATNFGNVLAEFAGVASSLQLFGLSKYYTVPGAAVLVWLIVVKGSYERVEKVFLVASFLYIAYIVTGVLSNPNWGTALVSSVKPPSLSYLGNPDYLYLALGIIGATIAPWQQFYLQSSIVDKGMKEGQLKLSQVDAVVGSIFSTAVAGFIIIACAATLFAHGFREINSAADAAQALKPLGGQYAFILFAVGLFNASIFAASVLPLSTAYTVCEAMGFESGLNKKFSEAPIFYWLFTALVVAGAGLVLLPNFPLLRVSVLSQVVNGVLLPFVLVFMLLLVNNSDLMGRYTNSRTYNALAWFLTIAIIALTVAMFLIR